MRFYEVVFIVEKNVNVKQAEALLVDITKYAKKIGCEVLKNEYWGIRKFAYPIKKMNKGHYIMFCIKTNPELIKDLEYKLKYIDRSIIRSSIFNIDDPKDSGEEHTFMSFNNKDLEVEDTRK